MNGDGQQVKSRDTPCNLEVFRRLLTLKPSSPSTHKTCISPNYQSVVLVSELISSVPDDTSSEREGRLWVDTAALWNKRCVEAFLLKVVSPDCETV